MAGRISVVIVNYRNPTLTAETVASLRHCPQFGSLAVRIVDNGSADGSLDQLKEKCADCEILDAGSNVGFAGGCNVGIRRALEEGDERILLLNNDTEVASDFLTALLKQADDRTLTTPRIVHADNPARVWYGGGFVSRLRGGFYHTTDAVRSSQPHDVTFASGCCLLVPASFFRTCGLMREDFFLYYEDAELCLRAAANGFRIRYVPESVVRHKVSSTTGVDSPLTAYYGTRNRLRLMADWKFSLTAFAYVVGTRLVKAVTARPSASRRAIVRGLFDFFRGQSGREVTLS